MRRLLPAVAGLLLLAGCGAHPVAGPTTAPPSVPPTSSATRPMPTPTHPTPTPTPVRTTRRAVVTPTAARTTAVAPVRTTPAAPTHAAYPATLARVPASATQAITVTASSYGSTTATYQAWQKVAGVWQLAYGPWSAHLGYNGMAPAGQKREGDGKIPSGVYGFSYLFGVQANPGVHYTWRAVTGSNDVWDDDPGSALYNEWVDDPADAGKNPEPMDNTPVYDEGAVIAYNTARTPGLGSAIFMHVSDGGPTAGCVSIAQSDLTEILRWMRPGTDISIGLG